MNLQDFITSTKQSVTLLTLHTSFFYCCSIANRGCMLPFIHSTIHMGCLHPLCNTTSFSEINAFIQWSILHEQRLWICYYYKRIDKKLIFSTFSYATSLCYGTVFHFQASNKVKISLANCQNYCNFYWPYIHNDSFGCLHLPHGHIFLKNVLNTSMDSKST